MVMMIDSWSDQSRMGSDLSLCIVDVYFVSYVFQCSVVLLCRGGRLFGLLLVVVFRCCDWKVWQEVVFGLLARGGVFSESSFLLCLWRGKDEEVMVL
jgi:hypothetical protein